MPTLDFKKEMRALFRAPTGGFVEVEVPELSFLMVDGEGDPNTSPAYEAALEALFPLSYAVKFASKNELGKDYVVPPLEGLWSAEDPAAFRRGAREEWRWTMMIMLPPWVPSTMVADCVEQVRRKRAPAALDLVRSEPLAEGRCVQTLHVGPYDQEGPVLRRLHDEYMPEHRLGFNGRHHEVYLGDPRRTAPEKLRTILRQPVKPL